MDAASGCACAQAADTITTLRAEIERLRAALWKVQVSTEAGSTANVIAAAALAEEKPHD
jgi:hypothetical protein